ncbi:hypothetical protein AAZX31_09G187800 [Glycine max]|nr:hypothetical protein JHK87_025665 [Glycine soja]KAG5013592.1 hypothetical protein JHK86_025853 [Glycine max]KAH1043994.1 hypothetical protein GYH30_025678 [Glycine max]KAH1234470.1 hypothetical protein GmHk_09G026670 [Glycine max]
MRASLIRTGSVPVQNTLLPASPRVSLTRQASFAAADKSLAHSPRLSMHSSHSNPRRFSSERDGENFGVRRDLNRTGSRSFPPIVPHEEEFLSDAAPRKLGIRPEDLRFGGGDGGDNGGTSLTGGNGREWMKIGAYYEEMLRSNPTDALLLRNYGKFLHEVEKDTARAEEYYGRAILANPGDGELLSLYGTLIWETQRDEDRAKSYFDQAIHAAPNDCTVLGSYAHFMWEAEEEEEVVNGGVTEITATEMIAAF